MTFLETSMTQQSDVSPAASAAVALVDAEPDIAREPGVVTGRPRTWLRVEGASVALAGLAVFAATHEPWWLVPALFLVPDVFAVGYLVNPRVGAWLYNLAHTAPLSLALLAGGVYAHIVPLSVAGAIGLFHIGFDRLLKYGVKYDHNPAVTHLGVHGKR